MIERTYVNYYSTIDYKHANVHGVLQQLSPLPILYHEVIGDSTHMGLRYGDSAYTLDFHHKTIATYTYANNLSLKQLLILKIEHVNIDSEISYRISETIKISKEKCKIDQNKNKRGQEKYNESFHEYDLNGDDKRNYG